MLGGLLPQVALVSQLGTGHKRWIRKNTTLPPASGLPLFNCPASLQLRGSYQSGPFAGGALEKEPFEALPGWGVSAINGGPRFAGSELTPARLPWRAALDRPCRTP